jgi:hypothetical protein
MSSLVQTQLPATAAAAVVLTVSLCNVAALLSQDTMHMSQKKVNCAVIWFSFIVQAIS